MSQTCSWLLTAEPSWMQVGPQSAGAHPGPVCYRKKGGLPALTDANLALGRILPVRTAKQWIMLACW